MIIAFLFYIPYLFYYIYDMIKWKRLFILRLPWHIFLLETWAVIAVQFNIHDGLNGIINGYVILFIIHYFLSHKIKTNIKMKVIILSIMIFLSYILYRIEFSIDYFTMISNFLSYVNLFGIMIIAYSEIRRKYYNILIKELDKIGVIYIFGTILFSILQIGQNMYRTGIIYGYAQVQPNSISIIAAILLIFGLWSDSKINIKRVLISLLIVFILVLTLRRTYLLLFGSVFMSFLCFHIRKFDKIVIPLFLFACIAAVVVAYSTHRRIKFGTMDVENEGRFIEYQLSKKTLDADNKLWQGNGKLFFTAGQYNMKGKERRVLHTGHTELLLGAGYCGLGLYCVIFILFLFIIICDTNIINSVLFPLLLSFFIIYIILSMSGGQRSPSSWIIMIIFMFIYNFCNERKNNRINPHVQRRGTHRESN